MATTLEPHRDCGKPAASPNPTTVPSLIKAQARPGEPSSPCAIATTLLTPDTSIRPQETSVPSLLSARLPPAIATTLVTLGGTGKAPHPTTVPSFFSAWLLYGPAATATTLVSPDGTVA